METYLTCSLILGVKSRARTPGPDLLDYRHVLLQGKKRRAAYVVLTSHGLQAGGAGLRVEERSVDGFGIDCALAATGLLEKLQPDAQLGRQASSCHAPFREGRHKLAQRRKLGELWLAVKCVSTLA
ncbi:hypothetical protein CFAM422_010169 [Trichoderma lentiforme]|uniref:Uncharacterized protein n=1 Tax=Trichoderma lentiforme TaxID=1567552 RepID=A0A9P4X8L6_9HYPO|nr:hypothetical protein CFAM422_010169 [Trichoderma lentiforme]